ncbi:MAG: hypothetical protein UE295_02770 [Acutalibacteraceae bacterium]|nr:hypothetical protein [Acutalibacteraceae bacterium]
MYKSNTPYISYKYKTEDYLNLNLSTNSDETTFRTAVDIFIDRIHSRFLDQIHILAKDCDRNGFSIMALECLLVETFAQFFDGIDDSVGVSRAKYIDFLTNNIHCFPSRTAASRFYSDIRCGILHQAQTKPRSALTFNKLTAIDFQNQFLMVSVDRFVEEMDTYFYEYCKKLINANDMHLRSNFIKKMDYICHR